jgi:hypothetical protein
LQLGEKQNSQELFALEQQLTQLKAEHDGYQKRCSDFELAAEKLKNDLKIKQSHNERLSTELHDLN